MTFKSVLAICSLSAALCGISPVAFAADSASAPVRTQASDAFWAGRLEHRHGGHEEGERKLFYRVDRVAEPAACVALFLRQTAF
jgi:hypothetical protein